MSTGGGAVRLALGLFGAGAAMLLLLLGVVVIVLGPDRSDICGGEVAAGDVRVGDVGSLGPRQRANAASVVGEGRRRHLPDRAIVIALAVASQESGFTNYANDGKGGDLNFTQVGIEQSMALPHEAVGTDHGSLGVFQQQWPWWGTMADLMDPAKAAGKFYTALQSVPGWRQLPLTVAAQRVQRSATPSAYADDEPLARSLLDGSAPVPSLDTAAYTGDITADCATGEVSGTVVLPLPQDSGYIDQHNWGHRAAIWSRGHTGTDLSVACGTPVLAANDGTVVVRTDQAWAGKWLVQVSTGRGTLTTWYGHMQALDVIDGQQVTAGQRIGQVGALGNASGCHLHFEVHPRGGSIYQDNVNPSTWLVEHIGRRTQPASWSGGGGAGFKIATFNTLGSSHTGRHGDKPWMASGAARTRGMVELLDRHHVDVAGLQEFQRPQYLTFLRIAGDRYAVYSPKGDTENAVVWRRDRWQLVSATSFAIPYFDGHRRPMPIVQLRSQPDGRIATFVNVHNPADTARYPRQGRWRVAAVAREVTLLRRLTSTTGRPVILTGDLNDTRRAFCLLNSRAAMHSSNGGSRGGGCRSPTHAGIDWIMGAHAVRFGGYQQLRGGLVRRTTDHPIVLSTVIGPAESANRRGR